MLAGVKALLSRRPVRLTILGSGSAGNCAYLETEKRAFLSGRGFEPEQIRNRLAKQLPAPEILHPVHSRACPIICRWERIQSKAFACPFTAIAEHKRPF